MTVPVITVQRVGADEVVIGWSAAHGAEQYRVSYERAKGSAQRGHCPQQSPSSEFVSTTTRATLSNMEEYSTYFVTVTATHGTDSSISSDRVAFMTLSAGIYRKGADIHCIGRYNNA